MKYFKKYIGKEWADINWEISQYVGDSLGERKKEPIKKLESI